MVSSVKNVEYIVDFDRNIIEVNGRKYYLKDYLRKLTESMEESDKELRKRIVNDLISEMRIRGYNGYDVFNWFKDCGGYMDD